MCLFQHCIAYFPILNLASLEMCAFKIFLGIFTDNRSIEEEVFFSFVNLFKVALARVFFGITNFKPPESINLFYAVRCASQMRCASLNVFHHI